MTNLRENIESSDKITSIRKSIRFWSRALVTYLLVFYDFTCWSCHILFKILWGRKLKSYRTQKKTNISKNITLLRRSPLFHNIITLSFVSDAPNRIPKSTPRQPRDLLPGHAHTKLDLQRLLHDWYVRIRCSLLATNYWRHEIHDR